MRLLIRNGTLITPFEKVEHGFVAVEDGIIRAVGEACDQPSVRFDREIDAEENYVTPGLIDTHVHGGGGHSTMDGTPESVVNMAKAHAAYGTTSIVPTTFTAPMDTTLDAIDAVREAKERCRDAHILGIHLEGPFLSPAQAGAQDPRNLMLPDPENVKTLLDRWEGGILMMGAAPELPGGLELGAELVRRGIRATIAHSNADFDTVMTAVTYGYSDVTHLYSGCSNLHRVGPFRVAGVVEAGLYADALTAQVIGDGKHLPASLLRLIYKCKGPDRIVLITDGLAQSAGGAVDGQVIVQESSGQTIICEDGVMKLIDRKAFAGSIATMNRTVKNMVELADVPVAEAFRMATVNPARLIGARTKGRLAPGYDADICLFDKAFEAQTVIIDGTVRE